MTPPHSPALDTALLKAVASHLSRHAHVAAAYLLGSAAGWAASKPRAEFLAAHDSLISRELLVEVSLTGLSLPFSPP